MWTLWEKYLLQQGLKSCPKCNKSPYLVTLTVAQLATVPQLALSTGVFVLGTGEPS